VGGEAPGRKPRDVGNGLISGSLGPGGAWLSLATFHSRHGTVELTGLPAFRERRRGDELAVRRYRRLMTDPRLAFLELVVRDAGHEVETRAPPGERCVRQRHAVRADGRLAPSAVLLFRGRLAPPALAEITEVSPRPAEPARTRLRPAGRVLLVEADALPARAEVRVQLAGGTAPGWELAADGARLEIAWDPAAAPVLQVEVVCSLREDAPVPARPRGAERSRPPAGEPSPPARPPRLHVPDAHQRAVQAIAAGSIRYVLGCTALRTADEEVCLLADHRILPLSWTRDAYHQARLLLAAGRGEGRLTVAAHLRWLWGRCRRPRAVWMRSHLPNGEPKDIAFQLDQQLYPVLELADHRDAAGAWPPPPGAPGDPAGAGRRWGRLVGELWGAIPVSEDGLVATDENPADDPADLPFLLSDQIVYWRAATRLAERRAELGLTLDLAGAAARTRSAVERHFRCEGPFGTQWAYAVDAGGGRRRYQDANDLPTALAPLWGFCAADDPRWVATMRFAFSPHNPAYVRGPLGGLGSRHTPGTWPLGDVQEWVAASLLGEGGAAERALARLVAVAADDGLLPEAYHPESGEWLARPWFAWPGAALGALLWA
jgi:uncharacterized protein